MSNGIIQLPYLLAHSSVPTYVPILRFYTALPYPTDIHDSKETAHVLHPILHTIYAL